MQVTKRRLPILVAFIALLYPGVGRASLATFVNAPDPSYQWEAGPSWQDGDVRFTSLRFTSQTFQGTKWQHVLTVARPSKLAASDHAVLIVGGGRHDQLPVFGSPHGQTPQDKLAILRHLAATSHLIVATVEQIPYQPLFDGQLEDAIISYSITQYFKTKDAHWPVLQPMVKSVVRAMDTLQAHAQGAWGIKLSSFTVSGESKRGWTSWLTAAVDHRVTAVVPMVFDMLDMPTQLAHQVTVWGGYSEQLGDYDGLAKMLVTPAGGQLLEIIDPYRMRAQLTQPKLMIFGTNDRYWPVDAANLYAAALPSPSYRYYVVNSGHETSGDPGVQEDRIVMALAAAGQLVLPKVDTAFELDRSTGDGTLRFVSDLAPKRLRVMKAVASSLDFRTAVWTEWQRLPVDHDREIKAKVKIKSSGTQSSAAYIEASYELNGYPFTVSSVIGIVPKRDQ